MVEAQEVFYEVSIDVFMEVENPKTGKVSVKKVKETHLIDAKDPKEVQDKVVKEMEGSIYEWKIASIKLSKISVVY